MASEAIERASLRVGGCCEAISRTDRARREIRAGQLKKADQTLLSVMSILRGQNGVYQEMFEAGREAYRIDLLAGRVKLS